MDHINKKYRGEKFTNISQSESSSKETNLQSQETKLPLISSKRLDVMLKKRMKN